MNKTCLFLCVLGFVTATAKAEFVPDEAAAIRIAIAAWKPVYGAQKVAEQKPFSAVRVRNIWQVQRSSRSRASGGNLYAEVVRVDGSIRTMRLNR